jgi:hypothetical protein
MTAETSVVTVTNALRLLAKPKDIWSGKAQRSLRKKLYVSRGLPWCAYAATTRFSGQGDRSAATSFVCAERPR